MCYVKELKMLFLSQKKHLESSKKEGRHVLRKGTWDVASSN
jgi:hypothetical protein